MDSKHMLDFVQKSKNGDLAYVAHLKSMLNMNDDLIHETLDQYLVIRLTSISLDPFESTYNYN